MQSNENMMIAVVGADGGLGSALVRQLKLYGHEVIEVYGPNHEDGFNFERYSNLTDSCRFIKEQALKLDPHGDCYRVLVNCVGVNYIDWFHNMDFKQFDRLMTLNVRSHLQMAQELMCAGRNWFESKTGHGTLCEIISNASHVPMTNSAFYNATKGAQHVATMSLARELRKTHGLCVFGVSPNKLAGTGMSSYIEGVVPSLRGWTPEQAAAYQLSALPAGEETDPNVLAEFLAFLLSSPERHKYLTNTVLPYGA